MKSINESKRQIWRSHVEGAKKFSGSVEDYCRSKQITTQSFYYWKSKFTEEAGLSVLSSFIPIEVTRSVQPTALLLPDPRWLAELIQHLQSGGGR